MSIKITAIINLKAECRQEVFNAFKPLIAASRQENGNISYDLHQDLQNENRVVFIENWQDQAAIDSHNASEHFQTFVKAIDGKIDGLEIILLQEINP